MKVTIIASGSRGDVQPYVALGKGLKEAGHTVRILATRDFQNLVTDYGLEFMDMGGSMETVTQGMQALLEQGNILNILALSEKLGIPLVPAYLYPFTPTHEFPSVLTPLPQTRLTSWANRLSHRLAQQMMWQTTRSADNKTRRQVLHVAPAPFWGPFASLQKQKQTILYGYSPQVLPPPKDWGDFIHVTGYWFLDPPAGWEPPVDLMKFLQSGPPPIYIGFGSIPNSKPERAADLVLQALARTGQRGVLSSGWGGLKKENLPETVFMIGSMPHRWLFPQMAAVVHHGGAGTTAAGLWAGVPAIVTPFFGDQPFWGKRVYALGVGPRPIPRKRLTLDRLVESIHCAVSDTAMQQKAARLGERIRAEDGVARAVAALDQECG
jgi:sterol 3beta-glucosyltransferase